MIHIHLDQLIDSLTFALAILVIQGGFNTIEGREDKDGGSTGIMLHFGARKFGNGMSGIVRVDGPGRRRGRREEAVFRE